MTEAQEFQEIRESQEAKKFQETLRTERLLLRPFALSDSAVVRELVSNWNIASMVAQVPYPYPAGAAEEWIATHDQGRANGTAFPFAIEAEGALVGAVGVDGKEDGGFEIGYWIGQLYWGEGYATEAARRVTRFAFEDLGLSALGAGHFTDNPASGRVLTKLGFRYTGKALRHCLARGEDVPCRLMELARAEAVF